MKNKIESRVSSAESKITSAENKMIYLIVGAVIIDWAKVMIEKVYDKSQAKNQEKNQGKK
jgi:hypothetical protein